MVVTDRGRRSVRDFGGTVLITGEVNLDHGAVLRGFSPMGEIIVDTGHLRETSSYIEQSEL